MLDMGWVLCFVSMIGTITLILTIWLSWNYNLGEISLVAHVFHGIFIFRVIMAYSTPRSECI